jgi:hypothetical protein
MPGRAAVTTLAKDSRAAPDRPSAMATRGVGSGTRISAASSPVPPAGTRSSRISKPAGAAWRAQTMH